MMIFREEEAREEEEEELCTILYYTGIGNGIGNYAVKMLLVGGRMEHTALLNDQLHLGLFIIRVAMTCRSCQAPGKMKRLREM